MKRLALFICTLLCANVLLAQTFTIGDFRYKVDYETDGTGNGVAVYAADTTITTANIPETVTYEGVTYTVITIRYYAFEDCRSLTSVTIPNSVITIGFGAFMNCSSLTSVTIPNSVTYIVGSRLNEGIPAPFSGCSSLTSMTIDMSHIIGDYDSYESPFNIPSLQNLTLGENVTSIGSGAFNDCSFLQNVTCLATNPPTLADNTVFPYPNIASLTVPCGSLEAYSSATSFWNMFFSGRIEEDCSGIEQAEAESISFFPNPTKSEITFSQAIEKVEVIDLIGKTILTFTNTKTINIESLPVGAYYLRLTNEEKTSLQKVIKE